MAHPRKIRTFDKGDRRLLAALDERDRTALRRLGVAGADSDRVMAVLVLAVIGDDSARELLATLLADESLAYTTLWWIEFAAESPLDLADPLAPWLVKCLASDEPIMRRLAAHASARFRYAVAAPRLLELAREAAESGYSGTDYVTFLTGAARVSPAGEIADEINRLVTRAAQTRPDSHELTADERRLAGAVAQIAGHGPTGAYEWALAWCIDRLAGSESVGNLASTLLPALAKRLPESMSGLVDLVRTAPSEEVAGLALRALAEADPKLAGRYAIGYWRRCPVLAVEVLGRVFAATGDPHAACLVTGIAVECWPAHADAVRALARIGGPTATRRAVAMLRLFAERYPNSPDIASLCRRLDPDYDQRDVADLLVRLGMVSPGTVEWVFEQGLAYDADPMSPRALILELWESEGCLVDIDPNTKSDPPPYDELMEEFIDATGGVVSFEDLSVTKDSNGIVVAGVHNGVAEEWWMEDTGDGWLDLMGIMSIAERLAPASEDDSRRFLMVSRDADRYVFADPAKVEKLEREIGVDVSLEWDDEDSDDDPHEIPDVVVPPTDVLTDWLISGADGFPAWVATHLGTTVETDWDFSPDSVERLQAVLIDRRNSGEERPLRTEYDFAEGAAWYLGEVARLNFGGEWAYEPGKRDPYAPWIGRPYLNAPAGRNGVLVPSLAIESAASQPDLLNAMLTIFART